jgi:hypothetical protein
MLTVSVNPAYSTVSSKIESVVLSVYIYLRTESTALVLESDQ